MSVILTANGLQKSFGEDVLFSDVSFMIEENEKVAFVGPNGCGKSTLFKMLTGEEELDGGSFQLAANTSLGYLRQYQEEEDANDIYEYVLHAREDILDMEAGLRDFEEQLSREDVVTEVLEAYHKLLHIYEAEGGASYRSETVGVLKGLGFREEDFHKSMHVLSGGQKTRVNLARLLLTKPDLLLLDEPINHLDLHAIEWLEGFLKNYKKTVIIVAHDRYFLDHIIGKVIDLSAKKARMYKGNYTDFAAQKELWRRSMQNAYDKQQQKIAHEEAVIDKLKQFNREKSIRRAESRMKKLDKLERMDAPEKEGDAMRLSLHPDRESGKDVLDANGVEKGFDGRRLFHDISFHITRGERVAILGDNGCGKTTLLRIINEVIPPDDGTIRIGANVTIAYYDQEQQNLDENKTLFEELSDAYTSLTETKIRNVLAAFLFREDDVYKRIGDLSGGERGRISLCKLMLSGANFLILDEPTNHLDMESKEILEHALLSYTGTVLYVSHDRYFVNKTAMRILEMSKAHGLREFLGNYDYYVKKREEARVEQVSGKETGQDDDTGDAAHKKDAARQSWQQRKEEAAKEKKRKKELEETERLIEEIEDQITAIDAQFADESIAKNSAKLNELTGEQNALKIKLDELYESWEQLNDI